MSQPSALSRRGLIGAALGVPVAAVLSGCTQTLPPPVTPAAERLLLRGPFLQGALIRGAVPPGTALTLDGKPLRPDSVGRFVFGLVWDRVTPLPLHVRYTDGSYESRIVQPVARTYDIQHIDGLPEDKVTPDPVLIARINKENAAIIAARMNDSDGEGFADAFDWPAIGRISGVFGSQRILNGQPRAPHFGVDLAVPTGTPIHAPADGEVTFAQSGLFLTGGTTVIDHGHGVSTTYFHQSVLQVVVGQRLRRGEVFGLSGATGRATGPHIHWAMNWFSQRLDPSCYTVTPAPLTA